MKWRRKFVVNEHLDVVLDDKGRSIILIDGVEFDVCMRLVLNIPLEDVEGYDTIESIDEAADRHATLFENTGFEKEVKAVSISPEEEFLGHCSNLQAWAEHDYDTRLLHSNLVWSLLMGLAEAGDEKAKRVLMGEIEVRLASGFPATVTAIEEIFIDDDSIFLEDELKKKLLAGFFAAYQKMYVDESDALVHYGILLFRVCDDIPAGIASLKEKMATKYDPAHTWRRLGELLAFSQDINEFAIPVYKELVAMLPASVESWKALGTLLYQAGDYKASVSANQKVLEINTVWPIKGRYCSTRASIWNEIGQAYLGLKEFSSAIEAFRKSIAENEHHLNQHKVSCNLAIALCRNMNVDESLAVFKTLLHIRRPHNLWWSEAFIELGILYRSAGKYKDAIQAFIEAINLEKNCDRRNIREIKDEIATTLQKWHDQRRCKREVDDGQPMNAIQREMKDEVDEITNSSNVYKDLVNRMIVHSSGHRTFETVFSDVPDLQQFLMEYAAEIEHDSSNNNPCARYHLVLPSKLAIWFEFQSLSKKSGMWQFFTSLHITVTIGQDMENYYMKDVPFQFFLWQWEQIFPDLIDRKQVHDPFINHDLGNPSCRDEKWLLERRGNYTAWFAGNQFQETIDSGGNPVALLFFMPFSMFLSEWLAYFIQAQNFFTTFMKQVDMNLLTFNTTRIKNILLDNTCYKKEVKEQARNIRDVLEETVALFQAAKDGRY